MGLMRDALRRGFALLGDWEIWVTIVFIDFLPSAPSSGDRPTLPAYVVGL
jgi:hypothetical protein